MNILSTVYSNQAMACHIDFYLRHRIGMYYEKHEVERFIQCLLPGHFGNMHVNVDITLNGDAWILLMNAKNDVTF